MRASVAVKRQFSFDVWRLRCCGARRNVFDAQAASAGRRAHHATFDPTITILPGLWSDTKLTSVISVLSDLELAVAFGIQPLSQIAGTIVWLWREAFRCGNFLVWECGRRFEGVNYNASDIVGVVMRSRG